MDTEKFSDGIYFNEKHQNAPDFVLGSISVLPQKFVTWLGAQKPDEKGYVRLQVKKSKTGKVYIEKDNWKKPEEMPTIQTELPSTAQDRIYSALTKDAPKPEDIPF